VFSLFVVTLSTVDIVLRSLPTLYDSSHDETINAFSVIEMIVIAWFTFELMIKFAVCPSKIQFIFSPFLLFDLLSIVPYYFYLIFPDNLSLRTLKDLCRIFKLVSLIHMFQSWDNLNTIIHTLVGSSSEILIFLVYMVFIILFFSTIQFYVESKMSSDPSLFVSIPATFW
jgi:hypothetical protein